MRASRRSDPPACPRRNGGRHPGSQDVVSLRGRTKKFEPWSVRRVCRGLVPRQANAPATTGVLWKNEEGNVVGVRQAPALFRGAPNKRLHDRGHVLRSVQRPVHRHSPALFGEHSRNAAQVAAVVRQGAASLVARSGKPTKVGGTGPGVMFVGRCAARRASPALLNRERSRVKRKKRKVVMAIVPARNRESRAQRPYVVFSCRNRQAASGPE